LDYENNRNPYAERKVRINGWKKYAIQDIEENPEILKTADLLNKLGIQIIDSLHIACAVSLKCDYFLTTDDNILQLGGQIDYIKINDPIGFIKEVMP
jgi:predicted nucleic acid-binding protein